MIITRLMGGLGNQMFQYAFGLNISFVNNTVLKIDTGLLKKTEPVDVNQTYREFELSEVFNITSNFASTFISELYNGNVLSNIVRRAVFKLLRLVLRPKLYIQNNHDFSEQQLHIANNTCLIGRWQSERYFKPVEYIVRQQFTFKKQISDSYIQFRNAIYQSFSATCLHIRRTDYVTHPLYSKVLGVLPDSYYIKAIEKLNTIIESPKLFIFSDDIVYAKLMLHTAGIKNEQIFIHAESPDPHDEMQLMTFCRHYIISNSTFSWWGAYLSKHKEKIVMAPERWSNDPNYSSKYILPETYYLIPC